MVITCSVRFEGGDGGDFPLTGFVIPPADIDFFILARDANFPPNKNINLKLQIFSFPANYLYSKFSKLFVKQVIWYIIYNINCFFINKSFEKHVITVEFMLVTIQ